MTAQKQAELHDKTAAGRERIAKLAESHGEHQFAREVRAGCWDHRRDVSEAIKGA